MDETGKRLTILIVAIAIPLLGSEWFLRAHPELYSEGYRPSPNPQLVYELQPGHVIISLNAEINGDGLHDRLFPRKKPPGVFRIAIVGDSQAFGWQVGAGQGFPKVLEQILSTRKGPQYEVINFSVPGYNLAQEQVLIHEKVIAFEPDLVIVFFSENDINVCNYIQPKISWNNMLFHGSYVVHFGLWQLDRWLSDRVGTDDSQWWTKFKRSMLGMVYAEQQIYPYPGLEETIYIHGNPPRTRDRVPERYWSMLGYANYKVRLAEIAQFLDAQGVWFLSSGHLQVPEIAAIHEVLQLEHVCDISREVPRFDTRWYFPDNHFNVAGHEQVAAQLYECLEAYQLI